MESIFWIPKTICRTTFVSAKIAFLSIFFKSLVLNFNYLFRIELMVVSYLKNIKLESLYLKLQLSQTFLLHIVNAPSVRLNLKHFLVYI